MEQGMWGRVSEGLQRNPLVLQLHPLHFRLLQLKLRRLNLHQLTPLQLKARP